MTPYNIPYIQELDRNGPMAYPGARYVVCNTGERFDLRYFQGVDAWPPVRLGCRAALEGRSVRYSSFLREHQLIVSCSYVLFNRHLSLRKMSMMSHHVKLMPYSSM